MISISISIRECSATKSLSVVASSSRYHLLLTLTQLSSIQLSNTKLSLKLNSSKPSKPNRTEANNLIVKLRLFNGHKIVRETLTIRNLHFRAINFYFYSWKPKKGERRVNILESLSLSLSLIQYINWTLN